MSTGSFVALCAAAFAAAFGYAAAMPILPTLMRTLMPGFADIEVAGHAGAYAAVYMIAVVVFSPIWGAASDRYGARGVIAVGLLGSLVAALVAVFAAAMWSGYAARLLQGAFAAALLPTATAALAAIPDTAERARKMAALGSATLLGFFAAPAVTAGIVTWNVQGTVAASFYATALVATGALVLVFGLLRSSPPSSLRTPPAEVASMPWRFVALNLLVYFGLGGFEVALPLASGALGIEAAQVSLLFAVCSLVMLAAQGALLAAAPYRESFPRVLAMAMGAYALGLFFLAGAGTLSAAAASVGLIGIAAGLVLPLIVYLATLEIAGRPGAALGTLTAAGGLGQALGSATGGIAYGYAGALVFVVMGIVVALGAFLVARSFAPRWLRDGRSYIEH
jgi:MFS family permease